jgi:hypothetical protein
MTNLMPLLSFLPQIATSDVLKLYIVATILVTLTTIGMYLIIFRKDEEKRSKAVGAIPLIIAAFVVMSLMLPITTGINKVLSESQGLIHHNMNTETYNEQTILEKKDTEATYIEKTITVIFDLLTSSLVEIRKLIYGADMSLEKMLFEDSSRILVNLNVQWQGKPVNLYNLMVNMVYIFILFILTKIALTTLKSAVDEKEAVQLRETITDLVLLPIMIVIAPMFVNALWVINREIVFALGLIDFTVLQAPEFEAFSSEFTAANYGIKAAIIRLFMFFIEFKVWFVLLLRTAMLNGLYILLPVAITINIIGQQFDTVNQILRQILKYTFIPFFYIIAYIVVLLLARGLPSGGNIIVQIALYMIMFKMADTLAAIFILVSNTQDRPSGISSGGKGAGIAMAAVSTVMMLAGGKSASGAGKAAGNTASGAAQQTGKSAVSNMAQSIKNSSFGTAMSNQVSKNATNIAQKIGASNPTMITAAKGIAMRAQQAGNTARKVASGAKMVGQVGAQVGGSKMVRGAAMTGMALGATAATGNPMAGMMAAKGVNGVLNNIKNKNMPVATSNLKNHARR